MFKFLSSLSRRKKQAILFFIDFLIILASIFLAFGIRLGELYFPESQNRLLLLMVFSPLLALPIFYNFRLYHAVIRYVGFKDLWRITQATSLYSILWGLIAFMAVNWQAFPRSVILINWVLVVLFINLSRLMMRWALSRNLYNFSDKNNVIIYGAGSAGRQLATALRESNEYNLVAFVDDSTELYKQSVAGLRVFSRVDLKFLIKRKNVKEVLIAIPSASRSRRKEIIDYLEEFPVSVRALPGVSELAKGRVLVNDLFEIDVSDLLGRDSVKPTPGLLKVNITKKVVMITGAGGSIGSEICRQVLKLKPNKVILYELSESALYQIEQELENLNEFNIDIVPIIGSVLDKRRLKIILNNFGVQTLYHAAAYKHVPLVESNQSQGVLNNTFGTMITASASIEANVEIFVLISTDKAVRPTNIMGASKRVAELILQAFAKIKHNTCFTMVRFGNVLDSSGSVIPLFKKQIKAGGPITVTHKDITRYFMTIPEAVELVIQAGAMAKGGEVFVLDMGKPVRIYDLAVKMIKLSGLELLDSNNPNGDIEIIYSGLRPGEKLYEELLLKGEHSRTENRLIMRAEEKMIGWEKLEILLNDLKKASKLSQTEKIYKLMKELVPEFKPKLKG